MSAKHSWFGWLLNSPPRPPATRMTADEAVALAENSGARDWGGGRPLAMANVREVDRRAVWTVRTAGIGANSSVEIDDATGTVSEVRRFAGR